MTDIDVGVPIFLQDNNPKDMKVPGDLLRRLREDIAFRRIDCGMRCLDEYRGFIESSGPQIQGAAVLLGYLSQWVDIGFGDPTLIQLLLARFNYFHKENLSVLDYVHLQMAYGLAAMMDEDFRNALDRFKVVLTLGGALQDKQPLSIAHFWIGRCLRRQGRYEDALGYVRKGKDSALELGYTKMAAVMQVLEGWIAFQEGNPKQAIKILGEAEIVLSETDDYVTRGNIHSAYGRIARRQGKYNQALHHFEKAIEEYNKRNPYHRNLARSLVNIAFVKRLFALQLREKIDIAVARSRKKRSLRSSGDTTRASQIRESFNHLRHEALEHLNRAREIYSSYDDHRGLGNVNITLAYLHLDNGEIDDAALLGSMAFGIAASKGDDILKARSRILQCAVECSRVEEEVDESSRGASSLELALQFGHEACEFANTTQNRRLIAKAYVILGLSLCFDLSDHLEEARKCSDEASALLHPQSHDYLWRESQDLKLKIRAAGHVNSTLREWSEGIVGSKTFQQVTEEFAAVVIPKVWKREGCKVARVAARLSISPKKVRRILREQGLTKSNHTDRLEERKR